MTSFNYPAGAGPEDYDTYCDELHGAWRAEEIEEYETHIEPCWECGAVNMDYDSRCWECGHPMDIEEAYQGTMTEEAA